MGRNKKEPQQKEEVDFSVEFHPEVEFDLLEASEYYENHRRGLGEEFILSFEASLNYIVRNPRHFPKKFLNTRQAIIKRFPFGIFYIVDTDKIYISGVIHLNRNPKTWKARK